MAVASALVLAVAIGGQTPVLAAPATSVAPVASTACVTAPPVAPVVVAATGSAAGIYGGILLTGGQVDAAATIVNVGLDAGVSRRGIAAAIAAAMAASSLNPGARNKAYVGLFQQREDRRSGLYTAEDRSDPVGSATMFFAELVDRLPAYDTDPRTDAEVGEVVQESGDAGPASRWSALADGLVDHFIPVEASPAVVEPTVAEPATVAPVGAPAAATALFAGRFGQTVAFPLRPAGPALAAPAVSETTGGTPDGSTVVLRPPRRPSRRTRRPLPTPPASVPLFRPPPIRARPGRVSRS